eukprot:510513-Pyramimonas_sp.AAC.1
MRAREHGNDNNVANFGSVEPVIPRPPSPAAALSNRARKGIEASGLGGEGEAGAPNSSIEKLQKVSGDTHAYSVERRAQ